MTRNFGPCGKCGKAIELFSYFVPAVTWLGKQVCKTCAAELDQRPPLARIVESVYGNGSDHSWEGAPPSRPRCEPGCRKPECHL